MATGTLALASVTSPLCIGQSLGGRSEGEAGEVFDTWSVVISWR